MVLTSLTSFPCSSRFSEAASSAVEHLFRFALSNFLFPFPSRRCNRLKLNTNSPS